MSASKVSCPHCHTELIGAGSVASGASVDCHGCGNTLIVAGLAEDPSSDGVPRTVLLDAPTPAAASSITSLPPQDSAATDPFATRLEASETGPTDENMTTSSGSGTDPFATRAGNEGAALKDMSTTLPSSPSRPDAVDWLPGYAILDELGRGGMGVVYKARQVALKRLVAVKMILAGSHAGPEELSRFRTEAEAIARLHHPNIIQIYEIGEQGGLPYFSLEYCSGGNLASKLAKASLAAADAACLVEKLARALHAAHQQHILHRDLKPANVLLSADGEPKITDFGLAKKLDDAGQTRTGAVMGTPSYMAPEQTTGDIHGLGPWTDVYGLGAILYELLTARPPFKAANTAETLWQVLHQEPVAPAHLQPHVPRDLETICLKCLQKEPRRRYQSAFDLAEDLRRFAAGEAITARPIGKIERAALWTRRHPVAAALAAVSALALFSVVLGALFFALYQEQRRTLAENELSREIEMQQRLGDTRLASQQALANGTAHFERADWASARTELVRALTRLGSEPELSSLREQAELLLAQTTRRLEAQSRRQEFKRLRDRAVFHGSQMTGLDHAANIRAVREAATQALKLYDAWPSVDAAVRAATESVAGDRAGVTAGCAEMLYLLADASAEPLAGETAGAQAEAALQLLEQAARLRPGGLAYHLRRAEYLRRKGQQAQAEREQALAEAARLRPEDALGHFLSGLQRYHARDVLGAIAHFEQSLQQQGEQFWVHFLLGVAELDAQRPAQAKLSLTACLGQRPDFVWGYLLRGFAHGEVAAAAGAGPEAAAAFRAGDDDFARAAPLAKDDEQAQYTLLVNRAVLRLRQKQPADAVRDLQQALRRHPEKYQAYLNLAEAHLQLHDFEAARAQLDRVISLQPELATAYRARARLALAPARPDLERALADLQAACACKQAANDLERAGDHKERGLVLLQLQRLPEALEAFTAALEARPDYVMAQRLRAETLMELERPTEAINSWDRYLNQAELQLAKFLQAKEPVANVYRARAAARARLGQNAAAIEDCNRSLALEPSAAAHAFRGWLYVLLETPKLALTDFERALALDAGDGDAYNGRGWCRVQLQQPRDGTADAERAVQRGPRTQRLLYNAARVYAQALQQLETASGQRQREWSENYRLRAVALLAEALSLSASAEQRRQFWRNVVDSDRVWQPLRGSIDFDRLAVAGAAIVGSSAHGTR